MTHDPVDADEVNASEWARPENWHGALLGVYRSRLDTRVIVPKRNPAFGWTINLGHPVGAACAAFALAVLALAVVASIVGR